MTVWLVVNMFFLSQVFLTYWCLDRLYTILDLKAANAVVIQKGRNIITGVLKQISLYSARIIPYFQFLLVCLTLKRDLLMIFFGCFLPFNVFNPASRLLSPF